MRLSDNDIKEMRLIIAEKLNQIPDDCRVPIAKDLLERLLFCSKKFQEAELTAKFPVWSGPFLNKIANLTDISFDGIVLDPLNPAYKNIFSASDIEAILTIYKNMQGSLIKYGETNITIDIARSFTTLYYQYQKSKNPNIEKPILTSVDLSGTRLTADKKPCIINNYFSLIYDSDLSYSGAKISMSENTAIKYSNLKGLNLTNYMLNCRVLRESGLNNIVLYRTNLADTGLTIITDNLDDEAKEALKEAIKSGHLEHCTVNKVLIASPKEREIERIRQKQAYEAYKKSILETIDLDILRAEHSR